MRTRTSAETRRISRRSLTSPFHRWIWLAWSLWWIDAAISVIIAIGIPCVSRSLPVENSALTSFPIQLLRLHPAPARLDTQHHLAGMASPYRRAKRCKRDRRNRRGGSSAVAGFD